MDILYFRTDFLRKVELARQSPTPSWVIGPRPSDECIATHRDHGDPLNEDTCPFDLAKMMESRKLTIDIFPKPDWAPVPISFKADAVEARGVCCYWTNWPGIDATHGIVLYMHGGAMVTGHPDTEWCAHLSRATGKAVLTVDYRMAPEHPMPAGTEDAVKVYRWLLEDQEVEPKKIAFYGRSAGATLVVLALQAIVSQALPTPACGVSVSAWAPHPTQKPLWEVVVGNTDANGQRTGKNNDKHDAQFNIFAGSFDGMPPLYVLVGSLENVCRDLNVSIRLAEAAKEAGVRAELDIALHLQHTPDDFFVCVPEAAQAVARAAKFMNDLMA